MKNADTLLKSLNKRLLYVKKIANTLLESGYYDMEVTNVELKFDNHMNHVFIWYLSPTENYSEISVIHRNRLEESNESLLKLIKNLDYCGVEIDRIQDLADKKIHKKLIGKKLRVFYAQRDDGCYQTSFINRVIEQPDVINSSACG